MKVLELLVASIAKLLSDILPSADRKKIDIAVRIALVVVILLILLAPVYVFLGSETSAFSVRG
jgi:hypothetical protein